MISYKEAGVNIEEGYKTVGLIKSFAQSTYNKSVLNGLGSFAGMYELGHYNNPVLVTGTDGVGTKLKIAFELKKYDTVGIDCVAMCVNDILCHGAKPLFFLDYLACGKLNAEAAADLVKGVSEGCKMAECALIGGETAEMPGFYKEGEYDIAGFAVGVAEKDKIIDGSDIKDGDVLIGIASSGIHSNGFSLVRKLVPDFDEALGLKLLTPTKIYVKLINKVMESIKINGMAHITGGGFVENIPRMFKEPHTAVINTKSYPVPEIFNLLEERGADKDSMYNTFNMGIGFVICVSKEDADKAVRLIIGEGERAYVIGEVQSKGVPICLE